MRCEVQAPLLIFMTLRGFAVVSRTRPVLFSLMAGRHSDSSVGDSTPAVKKRRGGKYYCCIPGCTYDSRYDPEENLSFHSLPKDDNLRKQWLCKIRRDESQVTPNTAVCSRHFLPSDFKRSLTGLKRALVKGAVPSIFSFPADISEKRKRKAPKKRYTEVRKEETANKNNGRRERTTRCGTKQAQRTGSLSMLPDHSPMSSSASAQQQLEVAHQRLAELEDLLEVEKKARFSLARFAGNDAKLQKYTGFRDYQLFKEVFKVIQPSAQTMVRWSDMKRKSGIDASSLDPFKKGCLPLMDQFFMVLCRLKVGFDEEVLSDLFCVPQSAVRETVISWITYLYCVLGAVTVWPHRLAVRARMPKLFKKLYPQTRVILDYTEVRVQTSDSNMFENVTFSSDKSTTYKGLLGINPDGSVVFVSSLFSGNLSDKDITTQSGVVDLLEEGDGVMVTNKMFHIEDILQRKKATLVLPPFLRNNTSNDLGNQMPSHTLPAQDSAQLKAHVEKAIGRVKEYEILQQVIPFTFAGCASQLWTVCALLTNFREQLC